MLLSGSACNHPRISAHLGLERNWLHHNYSQWPILALLGTCVLDFTQDVGVRVVARPGLHLAPGCRSLMLAQPACNEYSQHSCHEYS